MYDKSRIVDVDGYVHLIDGKIICFEPGTYDMSSEQDVGDLLDLAENLYVSKALRAVYGSNTVCVMMRCADDPSKRLVSKRHINQLPDAVQASIRRACNGYGE